MNKTEFQNILKTPESDFENIFKDTLLRKIREDVASFFITRDSYENFFDITSYIRQTRSIKNGASIIEDIVKTLCSEINETGFETRLSYGNTAIFIFKGDVPPNCW